MAVSLLTSESILPDKSGRSELRVASEEFEAMVRDCVEDETDGRSSVSQQKVSLFHNRQLRFSNLLPCSTEPEHLEKTADYISDWHHMRHFHINSPVHMLKRFSTLRVSIL